MPKRKHNDDASGSFARLDVFARGMIWGMHVAKAPREDICKEVVKKDKSPPTPLRVRNGRISCFANDLPMTSQ